MATPRTRQAGLLAAASSQASDANISLAADFYGLELVPADVSSAPDLWRRATGEAWPLVVVDARGWQAGANDASWTGARGYAEAGGTVLLQGLGAVSPETLRRIQSGLGGTLPMVRSVGVPTNRAAFAGTRVDVAGELAGSVLEATGTSFLDGGTEIDPIATVRVDGRSVPVLAESGVGKGRVWISAWDGPDAAAGVGAALAPDRLLGILPQMMLMRQLYGNRAWHPPALLANLTIDDPLLRGGVLGSNYGDVIALAGAENFHLTVAAVPRELKHADGDVVRLFRRHPTLLTACYHGNDHDGYEFYSGAARTRFRPRSRAAQERALSEAVARGRRFAARWGYPLDRVMVFPHGLGPSWLLPHLGDAGFLASCNWLDRQPLEGPPRDDPQIGVRPADLAWEGFPLLWRRRPDDDGYVLDLFAGRPAITFTHPQVTRGTLDALVRRAEQVNRAATRPLFWAGLEEVARHAYLLRCDPATGDWDVLMTANEVCLHNPGDDQRRYRVHRPHRPTGSRLQADGGPPADDVLVVTVAPRGVARVTLWAAPAGDQAPERPVTGCRIAEHQVAHPDA